MGENGNGGEGQQLTVVPPGFRFHPTDEELLYYYLRKKVSYEAIDLDVIREVDLNKLEPWDLKEKCRIGGSSGHENEWYFFSHKDKKYPTGTRTNRATTAGFWKATGRDKPIFHNTKRIGMRKTLVFYTGRAPHGHKTEWIMHEYRLNDDDNDDDNDKSADRLHHGHHREDGWVVCRVFKKKGNGNNNRSSSSSSSAANNYQLPNLNPNPHDHMHHTHEEDQPYNNSNDFNGSVSVHLPQLFSPETCHPPPPPTTNLLWKQMTNSEVMQMQHDHHHQHHHHHHRHHHEQERFNSDWSFLNKLLANSNQINGNNGGLHHQHQHHHDHDHEQAYCEKCTSVSSSDDQYLQGNCTSKKFAFPLIPFAYHPGGYGHGGADIFKFSK